MHLPGQTTTFQTRLEISGHTAAGLNDPQIAERMGCSVWTVRKWRRRWRKLGHLGLTSKMGRPVTGPMSTFPHELQEAILHLRQLHPGWGPATLLIALKTDPRWHDQPLPSRARIAQCCSNTPVSHVSINRITTCSNPLVHHPARLTRNGKWMRKESCECKG
jgi:transposase-like protein